MQTLEQTRPICGFVTVLILVKTLIDFLVHHQETKLDHKLFETIHLIMAFAQIWILFLSYFGMLVFIKYVLLVQIIQVQFFQLVMMDGNSFEAEKENS